MSFFHLKKFQKHFYGTPAIDAALLADIFKNYFKTIILSGKMIFGAGTDIRWKILWLHSIISIYFIVVLFRKSLSVQVFVMFCAHL